MSVLQGFIEPAAVLRVTEWLLNAGCYEVSLGDTIGVGQRERPLDWKQFCFPMRCVAMTNKLNPLCLCLTVCGYVWMDG